jgi:hypothetical protein
MNQRRAITRFAVPLGLTVLLLCGRLWPAPALYDAVSGGAPPSLHLDVPWLYLILAPLFTLWDGVSMLSMTRLEGFLTGLLVLYLFWRIARAFLLRYRRIPGTPARVSVLKEMRALVVSLALFAAFVIVGATWHRPMLSLAGADPDDIVVDFHSHTNVSHDVRNTWMRGFDAEANQRWHTRAGFDAAFLTDHNTVEGLAATNHGAPSGNQDTQAVLCPGIEVSAWRAHVVLLGSTVLVDRKRYKSFDGLLTLLATSDSAYGASSVASLPEYRRYHWDRLDTLAGAGLDGFEIVNASPKANDLTRAEVDSVVALARARDKFVVGVSDSHGWGATSMVWSLVRSPGAGAEDLCSAVLQQLRTGFPAVRVIERHRLRPDDWWPMWLTPVGMVWETWRSMGWALTVAWLVWIWAWALLASRSRTRPPSASP